MRYSVDSLENGIVTLCGDDGSLVRIPADSLAYPLHIGDVLLQNESGAFVPDAPEAAKRRSRAAALFARLKALDEQNDQGTNA